MHANSNIHIKRIDDVAIIKPQGDLERYLETNLSKLLSSLINSNSFKVILDLSEVNHIHYDLLKRLTQTVALFQGLEGDLLFASATPYVRKIFQAVACDVGRHIFNSIGEALLSFDRPTFSSQALH